MIELTVKTLDSQNHPFSVPDDITVKQLKERIAESISFPVESQRLIYCGRVLQDEKRLSEYDVNGKVIHLVQRPPPQTSRSNNGNQPRSNSNTQGRRPGHVFRQPRLDGNAMYLGAMAFPADLVDPQGMQAPPSHTISNGRLLLAKRMLRGALGVLNRLENPTNAETNDLDGGATGDREGLESGRSYGASSGPSGSSTSYMSPSTSTSTGGDSSARSSTSRPSPSELVRQSLENLPISGSIVQAAHAAAQAIAAAVSASHVAGMPNITIVRSGQSGSDVLDVRMERDDDGSTASEPRAGSSRRGAEEDNQEQNSAPSEPAEASTASAPSNDQNSNSSDEVPRTSCLAELLDNLNRVNERLQPFLHQYHNLMQNDPSYENNSDARESQRIFGGVSEVMHYLSHTYHALSDIMCDFSQPPPRALRCRPVLIQHSAVLQAGIPIQIGGNQPGGGPAESMPEAAAGTAQPSHGLESTRVRDLQGSEASFNITPGNVEFFMEVGPGSITIDSLEATVVTNAGSMGSDSIQANVVGGFPWGAPPPPEFIQNLMQAVAGHMIGRSGTAPGSTTASQGSSNATTTSATSSGQNSQARGNTATHPTTATQTRSTSRPHVHLAPATMQGLGSTNFDPFLPCNSHHLRSRSRSNVQAFAQGFGIGASLGPSNEDLPSNQRDPSPAQGQSSAQAQMSERASSPQQTSRPSTPPPTSNPLNRPYPGTPRPSGRNQFLESDRRRAPSQQQQPGNSTPPEQQPGGPPGGWFTMISNILNVPQGGSGSSVNLGHLLQAATSQSPSTAASSTPNQSNSSPGVPPFIPEFFSWPSRFPNASSSSSSGEEERAQEQREAPEDSQQQPEASSFQRANDQSRGAEQFNGVLLNQLFQGWSNMVESDLFGSDVLTGNLADLFMSASEPGENGSYQPGTSLFIDFMMTLARHMSFGDIISMSFGNTEPLSRIRPQLRHFIFETAYEGEPVNEESTNRVVERIIREIRPQLQGMQQARLREDVDLVTSTIRYNQIRLPEVLTLLIEGGESNFGQRMVRWFTSYLRQLSAIVLHCCIDGEQGVEQILRGYVNEVTRGIHPAVQHWTVNSSVAHMQAYVARQNVPFDEIRSFLVYRVPAAHSDTSPSQSVSQSSLGTCEDSDLKTEPPPLSLPEAMETDRSPGKAVTPTCAFEQEDTQVASACPTEVDNDTPEEPAEEVTHPEEAAASVDEVIVIEETIPATARQQEEEIEEVTEEVKEPPREVSAAKREPEDDLSTLNADADTLPDVVLGSEAWHNVLPSEWVPIIARDSQRQRRQNTQGAFSDAYLAGMPSKRRKVVTSPKPQGNINQIITESVRSALDEAGVHPVAGVETAGEDLELQAAYREQVRSAVQDTLTNNPDFTPDRFPNATKYFK